MWTIPTVTHNHLVIVTGDRGNIRAFSENGKLVWESNIGGGARTAVVVGPKKLYVSAKNHIYKIDNYNGNIIWKTAPKTNTNGIFHIYIK